MTDVAHPPALPVPASPTATSATSGPLMPATAAAVLGLTMMVGFFAVVYTLLQVWPAVEHRADGATAVAAVRLFGRHWIRPDVDIALALVAVLSGALGSSAHAMTSLASYIGNRKLRGSWAWWYVLRLPVGACLALVTYFVLRGGLLSVGTSGDAVNPYGVAAIACLTGMFSKQATDKLEEVFDTTFRTQKGGDTEREDKLQDAVAASHASAGTT